MNPAAISGVHDSAQCSNELSGPSSAMPAGASGSAVIPAGTVGNAVSNNRPIPLSVGELRLVFRFLEPKDLGRLERVTRTFQEVAGASCGSSGHWFFLSGHWSF